MPFAKLGAAHLRKTVQSVADVAERDEAEDR
jgi:hypothetical protein